MKLERNVKVETHLPAKDRQIIHRVCKRELKHNCPAMIILTFLALMSIVPISCNQANENRGGIKKSITNSNKSIETVLQLIIDSGNLQSYYFDTIPGREILCITGKVLPDSLNLIRYDKPVKRIDSERDCENCLIFDYIEVLDSSIVVTFRYPIQGIIGEYSFTQKNSKWQLTSSELDNY